MMRDRFRQIRQPCGGYKVGTELPPGTVRRMLGHVSCSLQSCRGPMSERHSRLYGEIFVKAIPQESYPISRPEKPVVQTVLARYLIGALPVKEIENGKGLLQHCAGPFGRNEIGKTRSASARICIAHAT